MLTRKARNLGGTGCARLTSFTSPISPARPVSVTRFYQATMATWPVSFTRFYLATMATMATRLARATRPTKLTRRARQGKLEKGRNELVYRILCCLILYKKSNQNGFFSLKN